MLKGTHGHYRQYSSKLLAGGSNPPGRATRISDGYAPFASNRLFLFWLRLEFCHPLVTHVQWLRLAHLVGILLCARSVPPRGALCDHRRRPVHRSMRARPFAGAARPGGAPSPVPPLPPDPKAGQHGPAALFAAAAAPGPFQAPLSCGAGDSQESRDFFGNFPWESGKILRRCSVGGSPSPRTPFDR